jgi:hypothetical protein
LQEVGCSVAYELVVPGAGENVFEVCRDSVTLAGFTVVADASVEVHAHRRGSGTIADAIVRTGPAIEHVGAALAVEVVVAPSGAEGVVTAVANEPVACLATDYDLDIASDSLAIESDVRADGNLHTSS